MSVVAQDRFDHFDRLEIDNLAEFDQSVLANAQRQLADLLVVSAEIFRHPHNDLVPLLAFNRGADNLTGERGADRLVHFRRGQTVTLQLVVLCFDQKLRRASFGLEFHLRGAGSVFKNAFDLLRELFQNVVIVSENFHR